MNTTTVTTTRSLIDAAERGDAQSLRQMLADEKRRDIGEELEGCLLVAGNGDVVWLLLDDPRLSLNEDLAERAMLAAVKNGRVSAMEALLQKGFGFPKALYYAAEYGHADCLRLLVDAGYNVDVKVDETTALHEAAFNAHDECVRLLLEAGADVTATNSVSNTPLHNAAFKGATQCAQLLLNAGADVHAVNENGFTPLHYAAHNGKRQCARILLYAGADVNALTSNRRTPLKLAQDNKHEYTAHLILVKGGRLY